MGAEAVQDILLRVGIEGDKSVDDLKKRNTELMESFVKNQAEIDKTILKNKELKKSEGDHTEEIAKNITSIKELQGVNNTNNAEIKQNMVLITAEMGSLREKRAQLSVITAEYTKLSSEEAKNSVHGKALGDTIKNLTKDLKAQELGIGQTYRNVGNYTESLIESMKAQGLSGTMIGRSIASFHQFKEAASVASGGTGMLNGALKMLAANPIMAIIALIAIIFFALKDAIGSSSKATNALSEVMAPLKVLFQIVMDILAKVVTVFLDYVKGVMDAVLWIGKLIGLTGNYNNAIQESMAVERERQELVKRGRELSVESAKDEMKIAQLRSEAKDKEKYTAEYRKAMLGVALKLSEEDMNKKKKLAEDELANMIRQNKAKTELNDTEKDALAEAQKKVYDIQKEHYMGTLRLKSQYQASVKEIDKEKEDAEKEIQKAEEDRQKAHEELLKKNLDLKRKTEDNLIAIIKDNQLREQEVMDASYLRSLEDIKGHSANEEALRKSIMDKYANDKQVLEQKYSDEGIKKEQERIQKEIELRISAVKKGSDEELKLQLEQLEIQRKTELEGAVRLGIDKALIEAKYNKMSEDAKIAHQANLNKKILDNEKLHHQNLIAQLKLNNESTLKTELDDVLKKQLELKRLNFTSDELFKQAKLQLENDVKDINAKIHTDEIKKFDEQIKIGQAIYSSLSSLGEIFAGNMADNAEFAKTMAIFQLALSTGIAVAKGIEAGAGLIFPANLAAILTTTASILAAIATAKKSITGAGAVPKAPKSKGFSTGGNVFGDGTGTSDSINARLSHGESVNNANSSAMFAPIYSALNQMGGGVPIQSVNKSAEVYGENFLANAFMKAALSMPSPQVSVEEITRVTNRVALIENLART